MTAADVMERALQLIGYTDSYGDVSAKQNTELLKRTVPVVNQILTDILHITGDKFTQISKADDVLPVSDDVAMRVMPWGVGMLIAQSENDGDNQNLCATMYNRMRRSIPIPTERVLDVVDKPSL